MNALQSLVQPSGDVWVYDSSFPAEVFIDGVLTHREARVVTAQRPDGGSQILVWVAPARTPTVVMNEEITNYRVTAYGRVGTTSSGAVEIRAAAGCGCGNPLKSWSPFREAGINAARVAVPNA